MRFQNLLIASGLSLCLVHQALADTFILATGRRDPRMYAIDLQKALRPENNNTPNTIVSRSKVALDRLDGRPLGNSANVVISKEIIVPNFRANNVSIVDLNLALSGHPNPEVARIPLARPADPDGVVRAARPKGSAVTSDGRYAVISGGARTTFEPSGTVWIIDLRKRAVVATVTGVGNDPYGLALVESEDD